MLIFNDWFKVGAPVLSIFSEIDRLIWVYRKIQEHWCKKCLVVIRSWQTKRVEALQRAKRSRRKKMPGGQWDPETRSQWFVSWCEVECISCSVFEIVTSPLYHSLTDNNTWTQPGGVLHFSLNIIVNVLLSTVCFPYNSIIMLTCPHCVLLAGLSAREETAGDPESPSPVLLGPNSA